VRTAAVSVENTHNFAGGSIQPVNLLVALRAAADRMGIAVHVDGARIWNAHMATGVALETYGSIADTLSVCLSKGLGAPIGSLMLGSGDVCARLAQHLRADRHEHPHGQQVGQRTGGGEERGLEPEQPGNPLLERPYRRVLGVDVVADLSFGHRGSHALRRAGHGVAAQIDHGVTLRPLLSACVMRSEGPDPQNA